MSIFWVRYCVAFAYFCCYSWSMTPILETERIVLRPMAASDAPAIQRHFNNFDIIKYMGAAVPWPYPDNGAEDFLKNYGLPLMAEKRGHLWAITVKPDDECVGCVEFRLFDHKDGHRGFWLAEHLWGQGLMSEALEAVNDFVFEDLKIKEFIELNAKSNGASRRLKEHSGGTYLGDIAGDYKSDDLKSEKWRITAAGWKKLKAADE